MCRPTPSPRRTTVGPVPLHRPKTPEEPRMPLVVAIMSLIHWLRDISIRQDTEIFHAPARARPCTFSLHPRPDDIERLRGMTMAMRHAEAHVLGRNAHLKAHSNQHSADGSADGRGDWGGLLLFYHAAVLRTVCSLFERQVAQYRWHRSLMSGRLRIRSVGNLRFRNEIAARIAPEASGRCSASAISASHCRVQQLPRLRIRTLPPRTLDRLSAPAQPPHQPQSHADRR